MRRIKFRAWDIFYKKFIYSDDKGSDLERFWASVLGGIDANRDVPVMQFTALTDRNGKEIYEGDIVRDNNERGDTTKVEWNNGGFEIWVSAFALDKWEKRSEFRNKIFITIA